jgi:CheY-like chemotaxis protein
VSALRVLVVDDSAVDAELLELELGRAGYAPELRRVDTLDAMTAALRDSAWDLVISDYSMPRFSGLAALAALRESALDIPFIMASGSIDPQRAAQVIAAGADAFVEKGDAGLVPAIRKALADAAARRQAEKARL